MAHFAMRRPSQWRYHSGLMSTPTPRAEQLSSIVIDVAREVGIHQVCEVGMERKDDGSLVTESDFEMQRKLRDALKAAWPQHDVLGEEMEFEEQARAIKQLSDGVFCVDPVDGTTNYANGFPFFGVSVGLIDQTGAQLGVVYDPTRAECFAAERGHGAWINGMPLNTTGGMEIRRATACVDYKRVYRRLSERLVASPPFGPTRHLGSSTLEWCWLACGRFHLYIHGGQKLWDYAAGALILSEAGGIARTLDGSELRCNTLTKRSVVAAADETLYEEWSAWINQNMQDTGHRR